MSDYSAERAASASPAAPHGPNDKRARPSVFGVVIGAALAEMDAAGRAASAEELPPTCATCAFRPGCMTNQMPETGLIAFKCAIGADPDPFACHHGMKEGRPSRLCAGYYAAKRVPWEVMKEISAELAAAIPPLDAPDPVRDAFDAWIATVDPDGNLDDYERGRLFLRAQSQPHVAQTDSASSLGLNTTNPKSEGQDDG